ncbi:cyclic nucleotide-binding domain-containing protein [Pyxidicoccus sp. MSG2]|uniref:cyclic nucleotide-binding domain-containing protein n=1 Tax=Pyxidicoccus sp. MSG2 TaxID=2996790 RepID=UPI00226F4337|nr:cyclic nucleotide-binding domain-containing protein [Pyxidicoccus sp. MSG2]MCY1017367.1 cyclic nucleotide-binding domain-containing protein [Pyxidicoccus sp. MSG2]
MSLLERLRSLFSDSAAPASSTDAGAAPAQSGIPGAAEPPTPVVTRFLQKGEVVVKEGDSGTSMFVVLEGRVAVAREAEGQEPRVVEQLGAGEFFGELALLTGTPRTASVVALEDAVVLELAQTGDRAAWADYGVEGDKVEQTARERFMAEAIRVNPLLATLSPELQKQLGHAFVPVTVPAGETLLTRGKPGDALYLLLRGQCEVFHTHDDGTQTAYPRLEEGALFGEISLLRSRLATATVRTLIPCTLLKLEREVFEKTIMTQPNLRGALVRLGLQRLKQTVQVMAEPSRAPEDMEP